MKLKSVLDKVAAMAGLEITPKWRMPRLPYTRKLQALFDHFEITTVLDIGANTGQTYTMLRQEMAFPGPIHSFEPDPALSARLIARANTDPAWTVANCALGAAPGTLHLNKMSASTFNSFRQPGLNQPQAVAEFNKVVNTVEVEVATLDSLAAQFPDLPHTFVKIDTQGFDLEVLKGGREVLRQTPMIQTEVSFISLYEGSPAFMESIEAFKELGFTVSDLFFVAGDKEFRAFEFDCIMIRSPAPTRVGERAEGRAASESSV